MKSIGLTNFVVLLSVVTFGALSFVVHAESDDAVGNWRMIDDETGEPKSLVTIIEEDGVLVGRITEVLTREDKGEGVLCDLCEDELYNQPILGLPFLRGMEKDDDGWSGGLITDPEKGKTYKAKMQLLKGGERLEVRGFIGFSLFGRTQIWERIE